MLPAPLYFVLLSLCVIYALWAGGAPERIGTAIMVIGSASTWGVLSASPHDYQSVLSEVVIIDVAAFVAFAILTVRADRFWPIWVTALAGLGLLGHGARWYGGADVTPAAYVISVVVWSYVILLLFAIGTRNHQRRVRAE